MSTYAGSDNCTDILLEMIAKYEANGNYNAVIGNSRATEDLSKFALTDIYTLMSRHLARGQPSTATGRYQFIRKTLQGLQANKKLRGNTKFTPRLQDELAVALMVGRGYSRWWLGQITNEEFAHNLSKEWASLPDPRNGGKSHYDGDKAGNHAGTTLAHVYSTLIRAWDARPGAITEPDVPEVEPTPVVEPPVVAPYVEPPVVLPWWKRLFA